MHMYSTALHNKQVVLEVLPQLGIRQQHLKVLNQLLEVINEATNVTDQTKYMKAVTFGLTKGDTFLVTNVGTKCNAFIDTGASHSCMSENFQQLIPPQIKHVFLCFCNFCL